MEPSKATNHIKSVLQQCIDGLNRGAMHVHPVFPGHRSCQAELARARTGPITSHKLNLKTSMRAGPCMCCSARAPHLVDDKGPLPSSSIGPLLGWTESLAWDTFT